MADLFDNTFFGATPRIFQNARKLRKSETGAEKKMWAKLKGRRFMNLKFRRQHPILRYVADFYCVEHKVVIELDGGIHNKIEQKEHDKTRTSELEKLGVRVIRFTNKDILLNTNETLRQIEAFIFRQPVNFTLPPPKGEGVTSKT